MNVDRAIAVLSLCLDNQLSVSELTTKVKGNRENALELVRELEIRGFLTRSIQSNPTRGRPCNFLKTTPLGKHFAEQQQQLLALSLHINDNDVRKAISHADMARKLEQGGVSTYSKFLEVSELASNIARATPTRASF